MAGETTPVGVRAHARTLASRTTSVAQVGAGAKGRLGLAARVGLEGRAARTLAGLEAGRTVGPVRVGHARDGLAAAAVTSARGMGAAGKAGERGPRRPRTASAPGLEALAGIATSGGRRVAEASEGAGEVARCSTGTEAVA